MVKEKRIVRRENEASWKDSVGYTCCFHSASSFRILEVFLSTIIPFPISLSSLECIDYSNVSIADCIVDSDYAVTFKLPKSIISAFDDRSMLHIKELSLCGFMIEYFPGLM